MAQGDDARRALIGVGELIPVPVEWSKGAGGKIAPRHFVTRAIVTGGLAPASHVFTLDLQGVDAPAP